MKKIPTIFTRDPHNRSVVLNMINPVCEWVFEGEGTATRKYDGTCCMMNCGRLYKRREVKPGKTEPEGFVLADSDEITGKKVGWLAVDETDTWHLQVLNSSLPDGTYELVGPKIQGNPEQYSAHTLVSHNEAEEYEVKRTYNDIMVFLSNRNIEGLVFHHPDGRMAKIKTKDFGIKR